MTFRVQDAAKREGGRGYQETGVLRTDRGLGEHHQGRGCAARARAPARRAAVAAVDAH